MLQFDASQDGFADPGLQYGGLRAAFDRALPTPCWADAAATRVLVGLIEIDDWHPWLREAYEVIDPAERARVERRRFAADRDMLALGYALHRMLLGKVLHCDPAEVPIGRDALGCPRLSGECISTSLSHADRCIALAVTATGPVGVDVEPAARARVMPEIAARVCHPTDAAQAAAFFGPAWNTELLALWVRKEAFLKASGVGLERDMQTFAAPENALLPLSASGGDSTRLRMLDVGPHWIAAVAGPPVAAVESAWLRPVPALEAAAHH